MKSVVKQRGRGPLARLRMPLQGRWATVFPALFLLAVIGLMHLPFLKTLLNAGWSDLGDGLMFQWNFWWLKHSLLELGQSPYSTRYLYFPVGVHLFFHDFTPLYGLLSIPLQPFLSLGLIYSLLVEAIFLMAAMSVYYLCIEVGADRRAALAGSLIYVFTPYMVGFPGQISVMSVQWLPLALLFWIKALQREWLKYCIYCGLSIVACFFCSFNHALFIVFSLLLLALFWILRERTLSASWRQLRQLIIVGTVVILLVCPILLQIYQETKEYGYYASRSKNEVEINGIDLAQVLMPCPTHPLWGDWSRDILQSRSIPPRINVAYIGFISLFLAIVACFRRSVRSRALPWAFLGLIMLVLALGPSLLILGNRPFGSIAEGDALHLPFYYLNQFPVLGALRAPKRLMVIVFCSLAVLSSLALTSLFTAKTDAGSKGRTGFLQHAGLAWLVSFLILVEYAPQVKPRPYMDDPELMTWLSCRQNQGSLLYVPMSHLQNKRKIDHYYCRQIMYLQSFHHRPYTSGYISRRPSDDRLLFPKPYLFSVIADIQNNELHTGIDRERIRRELPFALSLLSVDTIVLDKKRFPEHLLPKMISFLRAVCPVPATLDTTGFMVWEIPEPMRNPRETIVDFESWQGIDAIVPENQLIVISKGMPVLVYGNNLSLSLPAQWSGPIEITLETALMPEAVKVSLLEENEVRDTCSIGESPVTLRTTLSGCSDTLPGRVGLRFDSAQIAKQHKIFDRTWTGISPITTYSAGKTAGNKAWIQLASRIIQPSARGYCLVAWSKSYPDGEVAIFDTHLNPAENDRLSKWISRLPNGTIVTGVALDDVSANLSDTAIEALQTIGCATDMRNRFRWSHTFIGKKGLQQGEAIESFSSGVSSVSAQGTMVPIRRITIRRLPDRVQE